MDSVPNEIHRCAECGKTERETKFRLNGSGRTRKYCEVCSKARVHRLGGGAPAEPARAVQVVDDTPRPVGYAVMRYGDAVISFEPDRSAACLTDIWRAAGSPAW